MPDLNLFLTVIITSPVSLASYHHEFRPVLRGSSSSASGVSCFFLVSVYRVSRVSGASANSVAIRYPPPGYPPQGYPPQGYPQYPPPVSRARVRVKSRVINWLYSSPCSTSSSPLRRRRTADVLQPGEFPPLPSFRIDGIVNAG